VGFVNVQYQHSGNEDAASVRVVLATGSERDSMATGTMDETRECGVIDSQTRALHLPHISCRNLF
jgi:hypothetical protein